MVSGMWLIWRPSLIRRFHQRLGRWLLCHGQRCYFGHGFFDRPLFNHCYRDILAIGLDGRFKADNSDNGSLLIFAWSVRCFADSIIENLNTLQGIQHCRVNPANQETARGLDIFIIPNTSSFLSDFILYIIFYTYICIY